MSDRRRTLIVGGGLSGLGAAHTLRKRGLDHIVLEADSYAGGRVLTEHVDGFRIDAGANVFLETYGAVQQVAEELGVIMKRTPVPINGGVYHNGKFHGFYGGDQWTNRLKTAKMFLSFRLLSPRGLWQSRKFVKALQARGSDLDLDDQSGMLDLDTDESTAEFFQSKIGTEFLERFFQPILASYTFGDSEEVGIAQAMAASWHFGLNGVAWPRMPARGPGEFAQALIEACGDSIKLSTPVQRIVIEDHVTRGVITENGEHIEADAVICATTSTTALKIAPDLPANISEALGRVRYSKCCRVVLGFDSNPFPRDWYALAFPKQSGALMSGMSNSAVLVPESVPEGKSCIDVFIAGKQAEELFELSDAEVEKLVIAEVRKFVPAMPERPLFTRVYRWPEAVCLLSGGMINSLSQLRRHDLSSVNGFFLAGEYLGIPSTNGALRSGIEAAEDCAEFFSA